MKSPTNLTIAGFFAGAGGLDLGFKNAFDVQKRAKSRGKLAFIV